MRSVSSTAPGMWSRTQTGSIPETVRRPSMRARATSWPQVLSTVDGLGKMSPGEVKGLNTTNQILTGDQQRQPHAGQE